MSHWMTAIARHEQQNRVGAPAAPLTRQGAILPAPPPRAARPGARPPAQRLRAEGDADCSCTGTAIGAGLLGALLGFIGGWFVSDAKKAELKSRAKERAARAADSAAARLRR